jgi:hypothetical protein
VERKRHPGFLHAPDARTPKVCEDFGQLWVPTGPESWHHEGVPGTSETKTNRWLRSRRSLTAG